MSILRIDSSVANDGSVTRGLSSQIIEMLGDPVVTVRDLAADPLPQIDAAWATARATPQAGRTPAQHEVLALSDALVAEIEAADTLVIGLPVYNFSVPASLKAWIDLVARTGLTFRYTENGPEGLLNGKKVFVAMASGGTAAGSEVDFASGYLRHVLGFLGMTDVTLIAADALAKDPEGTMARARSQIAGLKQAA